MELARLPHHHRAPRPRACRCSGWTAPQDAYPTSTADRIKEQLKIYPYQPGGVGSSIGNYLTGKGPLDQPTDPQRPRFVEGTGLAINTIPPNDFGHYELLDRLVQMEPAEALAPSFRDQRRRRVVSAGQDLV